MAGTPRRPYDSIENSTSWYPVGSTLLYDACLSASLCAAAAPAVSATADSVLALGGCTRETLTMVRAECSTIRMSPRAPTQPPVSPPRALATPSSSPGSRRSKGSSKEATPARCTTRRKIPFRISWRFVVYAAHLEQRIPWSTESLETLISHKHWMGGVLAGMVLATRRCRIPSCTSLPFSSRALVVGRVSSHADAALQGTLSKRAREHARACQVQRRLLN
jgi:hypothetical protein